MAISTGKKSEESTQVIKRYMGVAQVSVLAVNPTKEEIKKYRGFEPQDEPVYFTAAEDVKTMNVTFMLKTNPKFGNGIETVEPLRFFCTSDVLRSKDNEKVCVIDKYGETAWVNKEEYKAQKSRSLRLIPPYRPCHRGEAELVHFLRCWVNMEEATKWDNDKKAWIPAKDLSQCECSLDWTKLMKGDISEIKALVKPYADHFVKVCFGIRTTDDNRRYTDIFNKKFLKNSDTRYHIFTNEIKRLKEMGVYANSEFSSDILHEWNPDKTAFDKTIIATPPTTDIFGNELNSKQSSVASVDSLIEQTEAPDSQSVEMKEDTDFDDLPF